uniref:bZIP transcription factor n=1 Tax=Mariniflexile sp. TaxID=1979402 RepID=UPI0040485A2E
MVSKKNIKASLQITKAIVFGLLLGFTMVFAIEHFGKFSYMEEVDYSKNNLSNGKLSFTRDIPYNAKISKIHLTTPFDTYLTFDGGNYIVVDMYSSFQEYPNKLKYYFKATIKDFKYIVYISIGFFIVILLLTNYKLLKTLPKKLSNIRRKNFSSTLVFFLIGIVSIGALKYYEFERKLDYLESEKNDLEDKVSNLERQNDDLQNEIDNTEEKYKDCEFYAAKYSENFITVESTIEYGLLKKYSLTEYIVQEENYDDYVNGQLRVKYKVNDYKEYSELLKAQEKDLFMKYTHLLSLVYPGSGLDHYYDFYPY